MIEYGKNMRLYTSYWGESKTFKLMPVLENCPFVEAIYDPLTDMLVVISKNKKQNLQFVPRLDENGNKVKSKVPKQNSVPYKEQRLSMDVLQEHYLIERSEQELFINQFTVNIEDFDYQKFFKTDEPEIMVPETAPLLDDKGRPVMKAH
tara:strand:- start:64 stop:510 length:447 start_codon:yes stop_codon:yes gene_type:complete